MSDKMMVSACLAGFPCRYDGKAKTDPEVVELVRRGLAVPMCPEQMSGLTTPRPAVEIIDGNVISADGLDFTESLQRGAKLVLKLSEEFGCSKAILKSGSPSCGFGEIYDGSFLGIKTAGNGIMAQLLVDSGFEIESR